MLTSARLDISKSSTRDLASTTRVRGRKCHLFKTNDRPAALPMTVSKPCKWYEGGSEKSVLGPSLWPKTITKVSIWSLPPSTQPNSSVQPWIINCIKSINMAYIACRKQPVLPFYFYFCNKLKALFTNSIKCHTVRIYGEILNYMCSCKCWKIYWS